MPRVRAAQKAESDGLGSSLPSSEIIETRACPESAHPQRVRILDSAGCCEPAPSPPPPAGAGRRGDEGEEVRPV